LLDGSKQKLSKIHVSYSDFLFLGNFFGPLELLVGYGVPTPEDIPPECKPPHRDCVDDMPGGGQDTGCNPFKPICEEIEDKDNVCRVCVNDKPDGLQDSGCNEGCMICAGNGEGAVELAPGKFGDVCKVCIDVKNFGG
jgi:hypothetical protein